MKTNTTITSSISVEKQNWREIKNKIDSVVSNFLEEQSLNDVKFYTDIDIDFIYKRFKCTPVFKILINCWHKSENSYLPSSPITKAQTKELVNTLNYKFTDIDKSHTYFYTWNLEFDSKEENYVCAEFPLGIELLVYN